MLDRRNTVYVYTVVLGNVHEPQKDNLGSDSDVIALRSLYSKSTLGNTTVPEAGEWEGA